MGMPAILEIVDARASEADIDEVFNYFNHVDEKFSTYKEESEISKINRGEVLQEAFSDEMKEVLQLAKETKEETQGYFDVTTPEGSIDPSGVVKGWSIQKAAEMLRSKGFENFYVEIGGDIQTSGMNEDGAEWSIGIRNPLSPTANEIVKVVYPHGKGIATSGSYLRGSHIYTPNSSGIPSNFVSLTVIGPNVYEADRFATASFAMGLPGMHFLESLPSFEAYSIDSKGNALMTTGFSNYTHV
jgi:thiamine biosynthesis lipoprotein